jgi:hypothetical protein
MKARSALLRVGISGMAVLSVAVGTVALAQSEMDRPQQTRNRDQRALPSTLPKTLVFREKTDAGGQRVVEVLAVPKYVQSEASAAEAFLSKNAESADFKVVREDRELSTLSAEELDAYRGRDTWYAYYGWNTGVNWGCAFGCNWHLSAWVNWGNSVYAYNPYFSYGFGGWNYYFYRPYGWWGW